MIVFLLKYICIVKHVEWYAPKHLKRIHLEGEIRSDP